MRGCHAFLKKFSWLLGSSGLVGAAQRLSRVFAGHLGAPEPSTTRASQQRQGDHSANNNRWTVGACTYTDSGTRKCPSIYTPMRVPTRARALHML